MASFRFWSCEFAVIIVGSSVSAAIVSDAWLRFTVMLRRYAALWDLDAVVEEFCIEGFRDYSRYTYRIIILNKMM